MSLTSYSFTTTLQTRGAAQPLMATSTVTFQTTTVSTLPYNVAREAVVALLDARDFLGYQLAHAKGTIDRDAFRTIASTYLKKKARQDPRLLEQKVATLVSLLGERVDTDVVSTVFNCELDDAAEALLGVDESLCPNSVTKRTCVSCSPNSMTFSS